MNSERKMTRTGQEDMEESINLAISPNEMPSMHTHQKLIKKVQMYVGKIKEQIKYEVDLCISDQLNLNHSMQGIIDYEKTQHLNIEQHFMTIKA
jgi:hypothetical protein